MTERVTPPVPNSITAQTQSAKHPAGNTLRIVFMFGMSSGPFTVLLMAGLRRNAAVL